MRRSEEGNGFVFQKYEVNEMLKELKRALKLYETDQKAWTKIIKSGMKLNFTWLESAKKYVDLYKTVLSQS